MADFSTWGRASLERVAAELTEKVLTLEKEREALYHLVWKWGFDREEGTYHPDNPPADYGEWAVQPIRWAAGLDPETKP